MPFANANGLKLAYEEFGSGEPLVLIMGIGAQMLLWPDGFCERLAAEGYRVIRFDNRDVGLSTKLDDLGTPDVRHVLTRALLGLSVNAPYSLIDMADDVAGLLDALGLPSAHLVGASLGGMVAQTTAITHPHRVASLTSIMSTPGGRRFSVAKPAALRALLSGRPRTAREAEEWYVKLFRIIGGKGYPLDEETIRTIAQRSYERCPDQSRGFARQFAAMAKTGDRRAALRFVRTPTLVLHGSDDPLILPIAGRATAAAIPGARLRIIEGMGHDMPKGTWPMLVSEIVGHTRRAKRVDRRTNGSSPNLAAAAATLG